MTAKARQPKSPVKNTYSLVIELGSEDRVYIDFTSRQMAQAEYTRVKTQGIYCSRWVTRIELNEPK